jgi:hypothetical protein
MKMLDISQLWEVEDPWEETSRQLFPPLEMTIMLGVTNQKLEEEEQLVE